MSTFLDLSKVIDQELLAGRINVKIAKRQLAVNARIAETMDFVEALDTLTSRFRYSTSDAERDTKEYADICCR